MSILFIFIDGLGIGPASAWNPLDVDLNVGADENGDGFRMLSAGARWVGDPEPVSTPTRVFRPIDARLGVNGLPQSGTGQATLFCGVNCAALAGRHYGPWPHSATRETIRSHNLFRRVHAMGGRAAFANAFPEPFFERTKTTDRWSTTTRCCLDSGVRIRTLADLSAGCAVAADITGSGLTRFSHVVETRTVAAAAANLLTLSVNHDFTLFEYFHTDKAGHAQDTETAHTVLSTLSRFLAHLESNKPENLLLLVSSDHGNIEDLSVKSHTLNPVPLAVSGPGAHHFAGVTDLSGVAPAIMTVLAGP